MASKKQLTLTTKLTYGKYKGMTIAQVWGVDPSYVEWFVTVTYKGVVADEVSLLYRQPKL